jgi:hypothetical protein
MAKSIIPDPLERRHLLERQADVSASLKIAEAYMEEGRADEAIDFFAKAGASDRLEALLTDAVEAGDAFLMQSVVRVSGIEVGAEKWLRCAQIAEDRGKLRYAEVARRQATRSSEVAE